MITRAWWRAGILAMLATLPIVACSDEQTTAPRSDNEDPSLKATQTPPQGSSPNHIFVMKAGVPTDFAAAVRSAGGRIARSYGRIGVVSVAGLTRAAATRLARRPGVEAVSLDRAIQWLPPSSKASIKARRQLRSQTDQSGAFFFPFQWNIRQIRADDAWLRTPQGSGALVCVLDTGVDPNHIDLAGKVDVGRSASFVPGEPSILDFHFHGTAVSSIITSNGIGVASVAPDARLCAVKVLDRNGSGSFEGLIAGIMHAADVGADVINMSLSALIPVTDVQNPRTGLRDLVKATQRAVDYARKRGTLSVAAASNDALNRNRKEYVVLPADLHQVVSVGATGPVGQENFDRVASYSNFGKREVDVFAPGGDLVDGGVLEDLIFSACSSLVCGGNDFYVLWAGTSAASPHVAGEAAVIESNLARDQSAERLEHCILVSADRIGRSGRDPVYGKGRIDVLAGAHCRREQ